MIQGELELETHRRYLWSDSTTVIRWIKTEPRTRQVFVAHRLGEIGELTVCSEWRWVPSSLNPADDATRWTNNTLQPGDRWFAGPNFLRASESGWPADKSLSKEEEAAIDSLELRKAHVYVASVVIPTLPLAIKLLGWRGLLEIARCMRRLTGRWARVAGLQIAEGNIDDNEEYWYREIQADCFGNELKGLRDSEIVQRGSRIVGLKPFIDKRGLLRAEGRVTRVLDAEFNNQPIILDTKHHATKMLIAEYHRRFYHASSDAVVNELRQKYYILGLRTALRSLISKCLICRLRRGKPQNPIMSALPAGRVAYRQRPFSHCGLDYFGPMLVKIGRRREKRWGALFTCLTTRAIHLELAHSLTTGSTIMALQRFAARRGSPLVMYSDNGTNFKGASRELKEAILAIDKKGQETYASANRIRWMFNPPDAPHMGGAWERLVRSVKTSLKVILREQAPSEEVLSTLLAEIEHSVNSRPLTHVFVDPRDNEALTQNHFLIGSSSGEICLGRYQAQSVCPRKQWRVAQAFADAFWKRWLREYLPTLIKRKKWGEKDAPLQVGDLVLIMDLQAPRNSWNKGSVVKIYPGADGEIRVAKVRTSTSEFMRPARKLIKLVSAEDVQN